jgi:hypothetical protein
MRQRVEARPNIPFENPFGTVASAQRREASFNGVLCRASPAKAIRAGVRQGF